MSHLDFDMITTNTKQRIFDLFTTPVEDGGVVSEAFAGHIKKAYENADTVSRVFLSDFLNNDFTEIEISASIIEVHEPHETSPEQSLNLAGAVISELKSMQERLRIGETGYFQSVTVSLTVSGYATISQPLLLECPHDGLTKEHLELLAVDSFDTCVDMSFVSGDDGAYWTNSNNAIALKTTSEVVSPEHPIYKAFEVALPRNIKTCWA